MSLLFQIVFAHECTSTHHKLALDALRHLRGEHGPRWRDLLLKHFDAYLDGAKAPDTQFKDFRNHVIHVRERFWGGAVETSRLWYEKALRALQEKRWSDAAFAAGVLSHYYTDPLQPLHTAQTEEEGPIHRAVEWSVFKSYDELQTILVRDFGGYPNVETPAGADWLSEMIRKGAEMAHAHYATIIDHYNLEKGVSDPPAGLDQELKDCFARLIGQAVVGFARVLERLFNESRVEPPMSRITVLGYLAALTIPISWVTRKLADWREGATVKAMYAELQRTGRVLQTLPEDDQAVRHLHAIEVLKVPLRTLDERQPRPAGLQHGSGTPPRTRRETPQPTDAATETPPETVSMAQASPAVRRRDAQRLHADDGVVDAPGIGPKTAERLRTIDVVTVGDLLDLAPEKGALDLNVRHIDADQIYRWQCAARLACRLPHLNGTAAQLLVACGFETVELIAMSNVDVVLSLFKSHAKSTDGRRLLRSSPLPEREAIQTWIMAAGSASRTAPRRVA